MRRVNTFLLFLIFCCYFLFSEDTPPYRNPRLPIEQRVADLLSRMSPQEKAAQRISAMERTVVASDPKSSLVDFKGNFLPERAASLMKDGIGQISHASRVRGPRETAIFANSVQKWAKENTRLGIPVLFHEEVVEPGTFKIMTGGNSANLVETTLIVAAK
jgi:beta-glucosidase